MRIYTAKVRMFPPRKDLEAWFLSEPSEWEWYEIDEINSVETEYARPIRGEDGRPGVSVKLRLTTEDDAPALEELDWAQFTGLPGEQVEFIRAELVRETPSDQVTRCYSCGKFILNKPWTDGDGDAFCSAACLDAENGEGAYRVAPDGTVMEEA